MNALVVEDQEMFRELFVKACLSRGGIESVRECATYSEARRALMSEDFDYIIFDINLPDGNGLALCEECIRATRPPYFIGISAYWDNMTIYRAMRLNIDGLIDKNGQEFSAVVLATEEARAGRHFVSRTIMDCWAAMARDPCAFYKILTHKECEILSDIAVGTTNDGIADRMGISRLTVQWHRRRIMWKLNIHKISELITYANAAGFQRNRVTQQHAGKC
jgi:DNA-binding NarL/FixJ family response regulator